MGRMRRSGFVRPRGGFVAAGGGFVPPRRGVSGAPVDTLLSIAVTFSDDGSSTLSGTTWRPTVGTQRVHAIATGTYSISGAVDITTSVTWTSGTVGTATISNAGGSEGHLTAVSAYAGGDSPAAATTLVTATLGAVSGNATLSLDVARDATSGVRCPVNPYQFGMLSMPTNDLSIWLCNETAGDLADVGGSGLNLTANATAAGNYNQSFAGWSRPGVKLDGGTSQRFSSASFADATAVSVLAFAVGCYTGTPAAGAFVTAIGSNNDASVGAGASAEQHYRYREGGNISNTTALITTPKMLCFQRDLSGTPRARVFTDTEVLRPTFGAASGTSFGFGGVTGGTAATWGGVWLFAYRNASAQQSEATVKSWAARLGHAPTWTAT